MSHVNDILYIDLNEDIFQISVDGKGANGNNGTPGLPGADGAGVVAGGITGQVLAKKTNADFDTEWVDQVGGALANKISSIPSGDWKQITSMEYNPITGQLRILYENM